MIISNHQGTLDTCSTILRLAGFETATAQEMTTARTGSYEEILCEAHYKNFRRFEAAARIK